MKRSSILSKEGFAIKMAMLEQGITGVELAGRIGKTKSTVSDVISGRNRNEETKRMIMKELGIKAG